MRVRERDFHILDLHFRLEKYLFYLNKLNLASILTHIVLLSFPEVYSS